MTTAKQISPEMTLKVDGDIYTVEDVQNVKVAGGLVRTKLKNVFTQQVLEKSFKIDQHVQEVSPVKRTLEFLYQKGKEFFFMDIGNYEIITVSADILSKTTDFLKSWVHVEAIFYDDRVCSVELPEYIEIMVMKTEGGEAAGSSSMIKATLETGATIMVPSYISNSDVIRVNTMTRECTMRV